MAQRILDIDVTDQSMTWQLRELVPGSHDKIVARDHGDLDLDLDPLCESTITLLVKLQHLLADVLHVLADVLSERQNLMSRLQALSQQEPHSLADLAQILRDLHEWQLEPTAVQDIDAALYDLARVLGTHLYRVLFKLQAPIETSLNESLNSLGADDLLRVELEFEGKCEPLLSSWPWEYLFSPLDQRIAGTGRFLAQTTQLVLNRTLAFPAGSQMSFMTPQPVKVLLVVAAPRDLAPVQSTPVLEAVQQLKSSGVIDLTDLIEPKIELSPDYHPTASRENFRLCVQKNPNIIHFIGHGQRKNGGGQLAFVGKNGEAEWVSDEEFAELAALSKELKLVFLQACESALPDPHTPVSGVARRLAHKNIPAVVAMQAKIENEVANTFATRFYQALAKNKPVDCAVAEGREAIKDDLTKKQALAFGVPVLYLRSYEALIGQKTDSRPAARHLAQGQRPCPRCREPVSGDQQYCVCKFRLVCEKCGTPIVREDQKYCADEHGTCGIRFFCPRCKMRLDNANGKRCGECGLILRCAVCDHVRDDDRAPDCTCGEPYPPSPPWSPPSARLAGSA